MVRVGDAGVAFGAGGTDVPVGNFRGGYRGELRLSGGYELTPASPFQMIRIMIRAQIGRAHV